MARALPPPSVHVPHKGPPPPPPPGFPGSLPPSIVGGRGPSGPPPGLTSPAIAGRYGATLYANKTTLPAQAWHELTVDRPTIVWPKGVATGISYYQFDARPTAGAFQDLTLRSAHAGICYLSAPGRWWIWVDSATAYDVLLIACEDPALAARYLAEPGVQTATAPSTGHVTGAATVTTLIAAANRDRKCLVIQNTTGGTCALRLGLGAAPNVASVYPGGDGQVIQHNGIVQYSGDTLYRGNVYAGSFVAWALDFVEYT